MGLVGQQIQTRQAVRHQTYVLPQIIQGVFFLTGTPPKSSKYKQVNLG